MTWREKKTVIALMLIAFLWSAVSPLFVSYAKTPDESVFGERILICTAKGFEWVKVGEASEDGSGKEERHLKCALCYAHKQYVLDWHIASYSIDLGFPPPYIGQADFPDVLPPQADPPYFLFPSRAPPAMA